MVVKLGRFQREVETKVIRSSKQPELMATITGTNAPVTKEDKAKTDVCWLNKGKAMAMA